jgi:hypothetical protein
MQAVVARAVLPMAATVAATVAHPRQNCALVRGATTPL